MNTYNTDEAAIYPRPAEVGDFSDFQPHLLLIDPPGLRTQSKKDCPELADLLRFFGMVKNAILWIPITAQGKGSPAPETEPSKKARSDCLARGLWVTSVRWSGGIRTCGCRLAYQLPSDAGNKLRGAVNDVVKLMNWNPDWVTHEGPPNQWIYCGSDAGVGADATQSLLRSHAAIWCTPPGLRPWPGTPEAGDTMWLVWRSGGQAVLLGGGILASAPQQRYQTSILWTDSDYPGVRAEAERLGYGGGTAMSFLRLHNTVFPSTDALSVPGNLSPGLNVASPKCIELLNRVLPIPSDT
jgi:hypothetical protein